MQTLIRKVYWGQNSMEKNSIFSQASLQPGAFLKSEFVASSLCQEEATNSRTCCITLLGFLLICKLIYSTQNDVQCRFSHIAICMASQGCTRDCKPHRAFSALDFLSSPRCHTLKKILETLLYFSSHIPSYLRVSFRVNSSPLLISFCRFSSPLPSCLLLQSPHLVSSHLISLPLISSFQVSFLSRLVRSHLPSSCCPHFSLLGYSDMLNYM